MKVLTHEPARSVMPSIALTISKLGIAVCQGRFAFPRGSRDCFEDQDVESQKGIKKVKASYMAFVQPLAFLGNKGVLNIPVHHDRILLVVAVECRLKPHDWLGMETAKKQVVRMNCIMEQVTSQSALEAASMI